MPKHFLSSELGLKIASLNPLGVIQSDIYSMDKLTSCELNRLITQETREEGVTKALLRSFPSLGTFPPLWRGSSSTVPVEIAELTTTSYTPSIPAGKTLDTKAWLIFREQPWRRFVLSLSFSNNYNELCVHVHDHLGGIVTPEIHIHENPDAFKRIMACIVFGQRDCIGFDLTITINPRMTSLLSGAFWARNIKGLPKRRNRAARLKKLSSLDAQITLTKSLTLDARTQFHSLPDHLPSTDEFADEPEADSTPLVDSPILRNTDAEVDDAIGQITVNENIYDLLKVIFCNQGLVGRGTVCYLARREGEEFIIKDHWVKGDKSVVLNEVEMLKALKDIPGVPQYVEHCLVEVEPGKVDDTQIKELVKALRDIVLIQKRAVEEHQVLHRDCSLNNSMIEDIEGGSRGALIDWEFAARITSDDMYSAGGTRPEGHGQAKLSILGGYEVGKRAQASHGPFDYSKMPKIRHTYHDDLESMFYVFGWICIMFKGPMGEERCLEDVDRDPDNMEMWLTERWHGTPDEVRQKAEAKHYFFQGDSMKACIGEQFAPYFQKLVPLAEEWYDLMREKRMKVKFDEVVSLFDKHINALPDEEDSDELLKKAKRLGDGKEGEDDPSKRTKVEVSL
ncbi:hypothetical protein P692DRAFT_201806973 [Suillus brevipes Sb2]|nr:hypothetical protein P692DRAFT_201806973 [Suillus brevipes Sb2]